MLAEQHYRSAIVALRDSQWESAIRHLLILQDARPNYRNTAHVLDKLADTQPVAYWRARFTYAQAASAWDDAQSALEQLTAVAPTCPDLPAMQAAVANREPVELSTAATVPADNSPDTPPADSEPPHAAEPVNNTLEPNQADDPFETGNIPAVTEITEPADAPISPEPPKTQAEPESLAQLLEKAPQLDLEQAIEAHPGDPVVDTRPHELPEPIVQPLIRLEDTTQHPPETESGDTEPVSPVAESAHEWPETQSPQEQQGRIIVHAPQHKRRRGIAGWIFRRKA
jgi:hypothetical protein